MFPTVSADNLTWIDLTVAPCILKFLSTYRTQTMRLWKETCLDTKSGFQSTHRTQTMRQRDKKIARWRRNFNPRIVRKRCDIFTISSGHRSINFNPRIVRKRCDSTCFLNPKFSRYFNPRIVRKRCDGFIRSKNCIPRAFQSTHRTQTMRPTCNIRALITIFISIHASYANDATFVWPGWPPGAQFQSTHRTQTMRRILSFILPPASTYFNPRIVRKRCDRK